MKNLSLFLLILFFSAIALSFSGCDKDEEYDNMEVITNTYTGDVVFTDVGVTPDGDFTGNGDSGTFSFAWINNRNKTELDFDITTLIGGSVQFIITDANGDEVLNKIRTAGVGDDSFSGVSSNGVAGTWIVTIILTDFSGDGSFSLDPID